MLVAAQILAIPAGGVLGFFLRRAGRWSVLVPLAVVLLHVWLTHRGLLEAVMDRSLFFFVVGLTAGWMWKEHRLRRGEAEHRRE